MESKKHVRRQIISTVLGEDRFHLFDAFSLIKSLIQNILFAGNILTASYGAANGWASINFVDLQKDDTSFPSGPLSLKQATLMVSICYAGAIIGNSMFPFIVKKIGSKRTLAAVTFPQIVSERNTRKRQRFTFIRRFYFR